MLRETRRRAQAAMEYLMTYGWAILVIAIVLGVLYYFGVFGGTSLGTSCLPSQGYLCNSPLLNSSGYLSVNFAVDGSPITLTGINCTSNSTQPKSYQPVVSTTLQSGNIAYITMKCYGGAGGPIGKKYSGYIWINYSSSTQNSLYSRAALVIATVGSTSSLPSSSLVTTTIPYITAGNTGSLSFSLTSGYTGYICSTANYNSLISSPSWAVDSNTAYSSVGRQASNTCTITAGSASAESMAGVGILTALAPTVVVEASCPSGCFGGSASPTIAKNGTLAFMILTCGNSGSAGCSFTLLPSGCSQPVQQSGSSTYGATIIAVCPSLKAGVQSFSWGDGGGYATMVFYEYHT